MYEREISDFIEMSASVGTRFDYVQGGGGNTSYKLDDTLMAVKASGFRLDQIEGKQGYVVLDFKSIAEYFKSVDQNVDIEKESSEIIRGNIKPFRDIQGLRPSVEAGFHALLMRAVIHSHSVYANIICCCKEGQKLLEDIFEREDVRYAYVPYVNPGSALTVAIGKALEKVKEKTGGTPSVIFMENHGLIVTADDANLCLELHELVNSRIRDYFDLTEEFPNPEIKGDEGRFISSTGYVRDIVKKKAIDKAYIDNNILYPDQLVYLNNNRALVFVPEGIRYLTNRKEAKTMEETLLAYLYTIDCIEKKHLTLKRMPDEGVAFINSWESEKYRKKMAEKN